MGLWDMWWVGRERGGPVTRTAHNLHPSTPRLLTPHCVVCCAAARPRPRPQPSCCLLALSWRCPHQAKHAKLTCTDNPWFRPQTDTCCVPRPVCALLCSAVLRLMFHPLPHPLSLTVSTAIPLPRVVAAAASGVTLAPADDLPFLLRARVDALSRMIVAGQAIDAPLQVRPRVIRI